MPERVCLVTGGSAGIGEALCRSLLAEEARVINFRSYVSAATRSGLQDTSSMRSITPSFQEDTGYGRTTCCCRFEGQAG